MSDARKRLFRNWPEGYHALQQLSRTVKGAGLEPSLLELVKMRASQINGCGYCIDMHSKDARAAGETAPLLFTIGTSRFLNGDVFHKTNTALPQEIWNNAQQPFAAAQDRAWGAALTLIMLVFLCTFAARVVTARFSKVES